jgi:hypothetical protein
MRPPNLGVPPPLPVSVLRMEVLIRCPTCKEGIGFLANQEIPFGMGINVVCPKCGQKIGVKLACVDLGRERRLIP